VALRMGFHHRLVERIPEPIAGGLRDLRKHWYSRRVQPTGEAS
jgi:hypothetical protein